MKYLRIIILLNLFFVMNMPINAAAVKPPEPWPQDADKQQIYMIGNGHIDPVWLWPWQEGVSLVLSTFRSALDRMNETPAFCFTASSALFYEWVAENDPEMLAEIRQRIDEGRWGVVGGWWIEPDVNIPNGEAFVRQGLYGQRSMQKLLGKKAETGFNPDGFGHAGSLPQILRLQGLKNYVFMRPKPEEKTLPANLFWWVSKDGARVLTYRIPIGYDDKGRDLRLRVLQVLEMGPEPLPLRMAFYGVGDHGGGSTKINIASILRMQPEEGAPKLVFSTPDRYFDDVRRAGTSALPEVRDELQHHAPGCYSVHSETKQLNRKSELALMTAEKITAIGSAVWGVNYPKAQFTESWKHLLFNQFHDGLAGTSLPEHYEYSRAAYGHALANAERAMYIAIQKLAWQIPTEDENSDYYVVFNPHAWPAMLPIEQEFKFKNFPSRLEDENGNEIPFQIIVSTTETDRRRYRFAAQVGVPAFGYRQIRFRTGRNIKHAPYKVDASDVSLENEYLSVKFDAQGRMTLFDKVSGSVAVHSARALVLDDQSDLWGHSVEKYNDVIGEFSDARVIGLEHGPVRDSVRVQTSYGNSKLVIDWILYAGRRHLEARVTLDWKERLKMLKFSFPTKLENPVSTYETPYGVVSRLPNGNEEPGQRWLDVSGGGDGKFRGVALINDAKYGYSVVDDDLQVSIVRSPPFALHRKPEKDYDYRYWMDQGEQRFRMWLAPHDGGWEDAGLTRLAEEFTAPVPVILQGIHRGKRPQSDSFISVDADNIIISVIKQAEDNEDMILRCYETNGRPAKASINLHFAGKSWNGSFNPYEIKTLRFIKETKEFREVNLLEEAIE